jgi:carbon starvation protein
LGLSGDTATMAQTGADVGEKTLFFRTGGAPSLALGMAHIFARAAEARSSASGITSPSCSKRCSSSHHRRRHARGPLHAAGSAGPRRAAARPHEWMPGVILTSAMVCRRWGYFLIQGVRDPLGGINSLWPLFGIQPVAGGHRALRRHHHPAQDARREVHVDHVRAAGLAGDGDVHRRVAEDLVAAAAIGFLAQADKLAAGAASAATQTLIFNARLDAAVCGLLMVLVAVDPGRFRARLGGNPARHRRRARARGALRAVALAGGGIMNVLRRFARLVLATLREISDENAYQRHLAAHGRKHSGPEWRRFSESASASAKCCCARK